MPVEATGFALRQTGYNTLFLGQWLDASLREQTTAWTRASYESMRPYLGARRYLNYLGDDDHGVAGAIAAAYGPNLPRLRELKLRYDPENVFHRNVNIPPA